jgi:peptidoglycan hydrolase-like protein with peptidoglycan-binding domain
MPDVPAVVIGRGAFSKVGKDNGARNYAYLPGKPVDGDQPTRDVNYQAVHLGVKAIQARVNAYGYSPALVVDGTYGPETAAGVKWVQGKVGISLAGQDGIAGPVTCRALWRDLLIWSGGVHHVPASQLYGFIMLESLGDPGAVGVVTPSDRGLNQINLVAHPNITVEQAFNPTFSIDYTAKRLGDARIRYSGKSADLKNRCAIAQHNSPAQAESWYKNEVPPTDQIKMYVDRVLTHALNFK